jgi:DNA-binding LytR/AlgR family response regulator
MKVVIVEDELPASQKLVRLLKNSDKTIGIEAILESVESAVNWFLTHPAPDLIFMDIQLEDGLCFEIFEKFPVKAPVIFITAYDEYALKAFKVNSVDYLLKPLNEEELQKALGKYNAVFGKHEYYTRMDQLLQQFQLPAKERFLVKIGEHFRSVPVDEISCFYIIERCSFLATKSGKNYALDYSLDKLEGMLDRKKFFRVSRNFILSFQSIKDVVAYSSSRLKIVMEGFAYPDEILVSRERVGDFKDWMDR